MAEGARIKVLIVDDHHMVSEALAAALGKQPDIEVVGAVGSSREAQERVQAARPDVVLMDYRLPDRDGVETTQLIKAGRPETKVVMITSVDDEAVLVQALDAGCSGFVPKNRPMNELIEAVRAAHAGEALVSPDMLARLLPRLSPSYRGLGVDLTPREVQVLRFLAEGLSNQAVADRLTISLNTVRNHVQSILLKLRAHSKLEAVAAAVREGIIRYP